MDKKGYIKTLEAVIAIVLILGFIFLYLPREDTGSNEVPPLVASAQDSIKESLTNDVALREAIINQDSNDNSGQDAMEELLEANLPPGFNGNFNICGTPTCIGEGVPVDKNIYVEDIIISATLETQKPKIVRVFIWNA